MKIIYLIFISIIFSTYVSAYCYMTEDDCPKCSMSGNSYSESRESLEKITCYYGEQHERGTFPVQVIYTCYETQEEAQNKYGCLTGEIDCNKGKYSTGRRRTDPCVGNIIGGMSCSESKVVANTIARLGSRTYGETAKEKGLKMIEKSWPCASTYAGSEKPNENVVKGKITAWDKPLKYISVIIERNGKDYEAFTNENGEFEWELDEPFIDNEMLVFGIYYEYTRNDKVYYKLYYEPQELFIQTDIVYQWENKDIEVELTEFLVEDKEWILSFASMYYHFSEVLEFYLDELDEDFDFQLPVQVYSYSDEGTKYWTEKSIITIDKKHSMHKTPYRGYMREYHEFSHYAMHALYGKFPAAPNNVPVDIEEINHAGFINPSTSDSYVEGFAIFMAALVAQHVDGKTIPPVNPSESMGLGLIDYYYNFYYMERETNAKADANMGRAEENAFAGVLWDLFDDDKTYIRLSSLESMYDEYIEKQDSLKEKYEKMNQELIADGLKAMEPYRVYEYDEFADEVMNEYGDDDNISLGVSDVWKIIRKYQNDFTSVYEAFVNKYPSKKKVIDEVYLLHDIFADKNPGDGKYDGGDIYLDKNGNSKWDNGEYYLDMPKPAGILVYDNGEEIGRATDYNRPWRRNTEEKPGYFIKVNNKVPFYDVEINFMKFPLKGYIFRSANNKGKIWIPIPPKEYNVLVTISPVGIKGDPLVFPSYRFYDNYEESVKQGYYIEHEFNVKGSIPEGPLIPTSLGVKKYDTSNNVKKFNIKKIIGYPLIILFALLFSWNMIRNKKSK